MFKFITLKKTNVRVSNIEIAAPNIKNKTLYEEPYNSCK